MCWTRFLTFVCLLLSAAVCYAQDTNCVKTLDLIFVVDGSNSIGYKNFTVVKSALNNSISKFTILPNQTRIGVVTYGYGVVDVIPLTDDVTSLRNSIGNLDWPDESTATHEGIKQATSMLRASSRRAEGVPQVIVVLTDGESDEKALTLAAAQDAKNSGITIFAVGVGNKISMGELNKTASSPEHHVFLVKTFDGLSDRLLNLTKLVCETVCVNDGLDVMFILDGSNSVRRQDFQAALSNISKTAMTFWRSYTASRIGLITYASTVSAVISITNNVNSFINGINTLEFPDTGTGTDLALAEATRQLKLSPRPGVPRVIVLITDGESDNKAGTLQAANAAKADGIYIFTIGVGNAINRNELTAISSDTRQAIVVSNFSLLRGALIRQAKSLCNEGCAEAVELLFVIDGSNEVGTVNFERLKAAVTAATLDFELGPTRAEVGVVSYSNTVKGGFGPVDNTVSFVSGISSLFFPGGPRTTSEGMRQGAQYLINANRSDVVNVMVVLTTGPSDSALRVTTDSFFVRQMGIQTFALGITNANNRAELMAIANQQPDQMAVAPTYEDVDSALAILMANVCEIALGA